MAYRNDSNRKFDEKLIFYIELGQQTRVSFEPMNFKKLIFPNWNFQSSIKNSKTQVNLCGSVFWLVSRSEFKFKKSNIIVKINLYNLVLMYSPRPICTKIFDRFQPCVRFSWSLFNCFLHLLIFVWVDHIILCKIL